MISKAKDKQVSSDVELAKQNSVAAASAVLNSVNSKTADDDKISNKNPENANTELRKPEAAAAAAAVSEKKTVKVVKKVDDPIVANFTVEGWPESKSRIATDYVNYDEQTAILQPNQVFLSPDAGMFHNYLNLGIPLRGLLSQFAVCCVHRVTSEVAVSFLPEVVAQI